MDPSCGLFRGLAENPSLRVHLYGFENHEERTTPTMAKAEGTTTPRRRKMRKPSVITVGQLVRMPLGELCRAAALLVETDHDTARFLHEQLGVAMARVGKVQHPNVGRATFVDESGGELPGAADDMDR